MTCVVQAPTATDEQSRGSANGGEGRQRAQRVCVRLGVYCNKISPRQSPHKKRICGNQRAIANDADPQMTVWKQIFVPYAENRLARGLGAVCSYRRVWSRIHGATADCSWHCTSTQYKSKQFRRWHSKEKWRKVVIHVASGDTERAQAKANRCSWDPDTKAWYVQITGGDTLNEWHHKRLSPAQTFSLRVSYEERGAAKAAGARWDAENKTWVYACRGTPPAWVQQRIAP